MITLNNNATRFFASSRRDTWTERETAGRQSRGAQPAAGRAHAHRLPQRERAGTLAAAPPARALRDQLRPAAARGQAPDDDEAQAAQPRDSQPPGQGAQALQGVRILQDRCGADASSFKSFRNSLLRQL